MTKWFNEDMTSDELHLARFSLSKEQYEAHKEEIQEEYAEILPIISKRESDLAAEGWIF